MPGPAFFACANNCLIDVKFGIIMDVEASRGIHQAEVGAAKTMISRTKERFGLKPERLAAETAYGSACTACSVTDVCAIAAKPPLAIEASGKGRHQEIAKRVLSPKPLTSATKSPQSRIERAHDVFVERRTDQSVSF